MFLIIRENDRVLVSLGWMGIRRGNVIVFRHEGMLIAHRVLRIGRTDTGHLLITKGDNIPFLDLPVSDVSCLLK